MKRKNLLICLITLGALVGFGSVKANTNINETYAAATGDTTSIVSFSGSVDNKNDSRGVNWSVSGSNGGSINGSNFLRLYGGKYIANSSAIKVNTNSPATMKVNVRKYGGPSSAQAKVTLCAFDASGNAISNEVAINPSSTSLTYYGADDNITFTSKALNTDVFFRFTSSSSSDSAKHVGISDITVKYTAGVNRYLNALTLTNYPNETISVGDSGTFSYTALDNSSNAWDGDVKYYSSSPFVVDVNENTGAYMAIGSGSAVITCKAVGAGNNGADVISSGITINVSDSAYSYPLDDCSIDDNYSRTMYINGLHATQDLVFNYSPLNSDEDFNVYSSNNNVISISKKGDHSNGVATYTLTAVGNGTANICFDGLAGDISTGTDEITVLTNELSSIEVTGDMTKKNYLLGESWSNDGLSAIGYYTDGTNKDISADATWTYSPVTPVAATVGSDKTVSVNIAYGDKAANKDVENITVSAPSVSSVSLSANKTKLYVDGSATLTVDVNEYASLGDVQWNLSDETMAEITPTENNQFKITAKKAGNVTVSATTNSITSNEIAFNIVGKLNDITNKSAKTKTATKKFSTSDFGSTSKPKTSFVDSENNTWTIKHSKFEHLGDGNSMVQIGSAKNPDNVTFTCSTVTDIVKSVSFVGMTNGTHKYTISVGDAVYGSGDLGATSKTYTVNGASTGTIKIEINNAAKALYLDSITVVYGSYDDNLSNNSEYADVQRKVIEYADSFMTTLEPYCTTCDTKDAGFIAAWNTVSSNFDNLFGSGSTFTQKEIEYAKLMFKDATPIAKGTEGSDILQNAMARYDTILSRDSSLDAFMARNVSSSSRYGYVFENEEVSFANEDSNAAILAVASLSAATLGALYLLKKRKDAE